MTDITERRRAVAEARFTGYQFGWEVEEVHHWHAAGGEDELCRTVLFCGEAPGSPCVRGHFYVRFRPGRAVVAECYAMIEGCLIGSHPVRAKVRRRAEKRRKR
jgi:hypothetical protein